MATAEERSRVGRLGALVQQSMHDPKEYTKPARNAFKQRFYAQTDPALRARVLFVVWGCVFGAGD